MDHLYIDNSVLGKICNPQFCDDNFAKNFDNTVFKNQRLPNNYKPIFTPFSIMEGIGLTIKIDQQIFVNHSLSDKIKNETNKANKEKKSNLVCEYWDYIEKRVFQQLEANKDFTLEHIRKLQEEKISHIKYPSIREKIKPFICYRQINDEKLKMIKQYIALDQLFSHNYRKDMEETFYHSMIFEMISLITHPVSQRTGIESFSFARVISKLWEFEIKLKKDEVFVKQNNDFLDKISKNLYYKGNKDLMDTELIHLAVIGQSNNEKNDPVCCYTCDDYEKIKDRVSVYKGLVRYYFKYCKRKFQKSNFDIDHYITAGKIAFCDSQSGNILDVLNVKEVNGIIDESGSLSYN